MWIDAPIATGDSRRDSARTGAPASAITVFTPTVRSNVLLPDMFDPLTIIACRAPGWLQSETELRTHWSDGSSGWPRPWPLEESAVLDDLGEGIVRMLVRVGGQ